MYHHPESPVTDSFIAARQEAIADGLRASRRPSWLRVATGLALIRVGEKLRGCALPSPAERLPAPELRRARAAS